MSTLMDTPAAIAAKQPAPETVTWERRKLLTTAAMGIVATGTATLLRINVGGA